MNLHIELLSKSNEDEYSNLLLELETTLIYASLPYRDFLLRCLSDSEPYYLLAFENNQLVGALPTFLKNNPGMGGILNSLPFFGSNGGVIVRPEAKKPLSIQQLLMDAFHALLLEKSTSLHPVISSPLDPKEDFYETHTNYSFRDERIGQLTPLPSRGASPEMLPQILMGFFHKKTRNSIRKAQTSRVFIMHSDNPAAFKSLSEMHEISMSAIGVPAKPWHVLASIRESFLYDRDYRIYLAEMSGKIIGALLVFFYNQVAEYYIPATSEGARIYQPMSLLVFEAMQEAVKRGCRYWNWGGTGITATGVYNFKKRWGTEDHKYFYYTRIYDQSILNRSR